MDSDDESDLEQRTVFCVASGCTPEIPGLVLGLCEDGLHANGPVTVSALKSLANPKVTLEDDLSVIGPIHHSGQPFSAGLEDGVETESFNYLTGEHWHGPQACDVCPEQDVRVLPHCIMGDSWYDGFVQGPPSNNWDWKYPVVKGSSFMVHTYALDIMVLATHGRMTPLRLWRLAMQQGFDESRPTCHRLNDVNYGAAFSDQWDDIADPFSLRESDEEWEELEESGDVEYVKEWLIHQGMFWIWMAPDCFPVLPTPDDPVAPVLPEVHLCGSVSALERLPLDILVSIVSKLSLRSLVDLSSTSRALRTGIFGNEYLARAWISTIAPCWIPVPARTPRVKDDHAAPSTTIILPYPPSQPSPNGQTVEYRLNATGLDWAYVRRCRRSGSMLNRQRIWETVLDIERVADLAGV